MGREIRRVPKDWQHPKSEQGHYRPLHDESFEEAAAEWKADFAKWESGLRPQYEAPDFNRVWVPAAEWKSADIYTDKSMEWWEYENTPPNREYYRPKWSAEEMTHYQMYETVSEGTPASPVFETLDQLEVWLVTEGYSVAAAAAFVKGGWAPSMTFSREEGVRMDLEALVPWKTEQ